MEAYPLVTVLQDNPTMEHARNEYRTITTPTSKRGNQSSRTRQDSITPSHSQVLTVTWQFQQDWFCFKLFLKWSRRIKLFNWEISPFNQLHLTFPVLSTQFHKLQYNYPVLSSGLMISIENCLLGQVNWNGSRGRTKGVMVTYLKTTNEWAAERDLPKFNYSTDPLPSTDDEGLYCRCCWSSRRRLPRDIVVTVRFRCASHFAPTPHARRPRLHLFVSTKY